MEFEIEWLDPQIPVFVSPQHKFGTDAFLLADFSAPRQGEMVCDFGTGCGIIPLLWVKNTKAKRIYGIDVQPQAIAQFEKAVEKAGLSPRVTPICGDLRELPASLQPGSFQLVACNPPYKAAGAGIPSAERADLLARHEVECTIWDVCRSASRLLQFGGRLCLCQRPERLADVISAMRQFDLEPKRLRFVSKNAASKPWLFLIEGKRGSKPFLQVEAPLLMEGENGFSQEVLRIYGKQTPGDPLA